MIDLLPGENGVTSRSDLTNSWRLSLAGLLCALVFAARCWLPAEGASNGETLWLVLVAALGLLLAAMAPSKQNGTASLHPLWSTLLLSGFGLIALACLLTTLSCLVPLERRRALNITGEWLGICIWMTLLLRLCQQGLQRGALLRALLSVAVVLSVLGCWQHFVELPRLSKEFAPALAALKEGRPIPAEFQQSLAAAGVSTDPESIARFEARLIFSREPIGFFALANTLAGMLMGALLWGGRCWLSRFVSTSQSGSNRVPLASRRVSTETGTSALSGPTLWAAVLLGVTGLCLLLTKSRTAVLSLGLVVGASVVIGVLSARLTGLNRPSANRAGWVWAGGLLAVIGVVIICLFAAGSLDLPIATQAVRSLSYRAEYWQATFQLLRSGAWLLGVGPGAFQDAYVQFKLPGASEEVADPHNLWLEAWTTGGVIAAVGATLLLGLSLVLAWRGSRYWGASNSGGGDGNTESLVLYGWSWGVWLSPWGVLLYGSLADRGWDDRLVFVGVTLPLVYWSLSIVSRVSEVVVRQGAGLAAVGLALHFQGAGGFGMPVLMMCWGLTVLAAIPEWEWKRPVAPALTNWWSRWAIVFCLLTLVFVIWQCWLPSMAASRFLAMGDRLLVKGRMDLARPEYIAALQADLADSVPAIRLMELEAQVLHNAAQSSASSPTSSKNVVSSNSPEWVTFRAAAEEALARRPGSFRLAWRWGEVAAAGARYGEKMLWPEAIQHLNEARRLYPTNTHLLADLATALQDSGSAADARGFAQRALELDDLNRQRGHTDRLLTKEVRDSLETLLSVLH